MKKFRKVALLLCALMLLTTLVACGGGGDNGGDTNTPGTEDTNTPDDGNTAEPIKLMVSGANGEDNIATIKLREAAEEIEEKSGGAVICDVYTANALGEMNLIIQSLADGTVDMAMGYVDATFIPMTDIMSLGYIVSNYDESAYILSPQSNTFKNLAAAFEEKGIELVDIHAEGLVGSSTTRIPDNYNVAGAAKNFMMRVPLSDIIKNCVTTMGYQTVSIVWADTYSSLQTGVCDGTSGQTANAVYTQIIDAIDYYIHTAHIPEVIEYMISPKMHDKLTEEQMEIVYTAIHNSADWMRENAEAYEMEYQQKMADAGKEILPITAEEQQAFSDLEHETNWPSYPDIFGQEVIDGVFADYENC